MPEEREDPIEAIKRRNEERARRLKERIAQGDFDRFVTPLEAVDEALPAGPEQLEAPAADFDLSFFPAPPEPAAVSFDEPPAAPAAPAAPEAAPSLAPPDFPPPTEAMPEAAPPAFPDFPPPPDIPPMEGLVSDAELAAPEPAAWPPLNIGTEEVAALASAPPPPAEVPGEDSFAGLELTELDLEVMGDFEAPQPWDGSVAETPPGVETIFPPEEVAPVAAIEPPPLEIVVEPPAAAAPEAATAQPEPPAAAAPPVVERVTPPPAAPVFERVVPPPRREEPLVVAPPEAMEPALGEEEVEAIKATIEAEIREMPPAAPPISALTPPAAPVIPPVEAKPAPAPEAPITAAPPLAAPARPTEEAEIFIGVEVRGNKVRIERRNITLAAAIELFQAIIDRYQNR